jgi:hypothetical protein
MDPLVVSRTKLSCCNESITAYALTLSNNVCFFLLGALVKLNHSVLVAPFPLIICLPDVENLTHRFNCDISISSNVCLCRFKFY